MRYATEAKAAEFESDGMGMSRLLFRGAVAIVAVVLPWPLRRALFQSMFGWKLNPTSRIGLSLILADHVILEAGARIGRSNVISPIGLLHLGPYASIGHGNRIMGAQKANLYSAEPDRRSALIMGEHSALTRDHLVDCTSTVTIGRFTTFAGYRSQILSHSPDFENARQISQPVRIGEYCFIGTGCIVLFGTNIPDFSIVGAGSVFTRTQTEPYFIYGGNPAGPIKALSPELAYFKRTFGYLGD